MTEYDVLIIGGGMAGTSLAMFLNKKFKVAIVERENKLLKKVLASGNGRCNISNINLNETYYNAKNIKNLLDENKEFLNKLREMGLCFYFEEDRIYPNSQTASGFVDFINYKLKENNIDIFLEEEVLDFNNNEIITNKRILKAKNIVLAIGSNAYVKNFINQKLLKDLKFKDFKPSILPINVDNKYIKNISGQRCECKVKLYSDNNLIFEDIGSILFKDFSISGIPSMQISSYLARGYKNLKISIDFLFNYQESEVKKILKLNPNLDGVLPRNFIINIKKQANDLKKDLIYTLKNFLLYPTILNDFKKAQVCSGGISLKEIDISTMKVKRYSNLYILGEIIDVDGLCGGYNISFAIISALQCSKHLNKAIN